MVYSTVSLLLLSLAGQASAKAINVKRTGNTRTVSTSFTDKSTSGDLGTLGDTTIINAGVQVWLSGRGYHSLRGNIQNAGSLIVSQTDSDTYSLPVPFAPSAQTVYWAGSAADNGNLINTGSILLNDVAATSAPTYDWYLNSFQNAAGASIQWCGRGDTGGSTMQFYSKESSVNNGLIVFEQTQGNLGTAAVWRNSVLSSSNTPTQTLTNNGAILLRNMRVDLVQNIQGTGCYIIGDKSNFYLQDGLGVFQNPDNGAALIGQSISFTGSGSALHMDTAVYSHNPDFGARVYGFGQGNSLEFYQIISSYSYSGSTLRVNFVGGYFVNIIIGAGYDAGSFSKGPSVFYRAFNAILYSGPAPAASVPAQCLLTAPICTPLISGSGPNPLPTSAAATTSIAATPVPTTSSVAPVFPTSTSVAPVVPTTTSVAPVAPTSTSAAPVAPTTTTAAPIVPATTSSAPVAPTTTKAAASTTSSAAGPDISPLGCYRDEAQSGAPRTLNGPNYTDRSGMTNQACAAFCTRQGFPVSGTEYGIECYCGSALPTSGPATCDKPCSGDASSICGGDWALTISINKDLPAPSAPASSTVVAVPTTVPVVPTSTLAPTTSAVATPTKEPFKYNGQPVGCFADAAETGAARTFSGPSYKEYSLTNEKCANFCGDRGFIYSGTEFGEECYCSNTAPTVTSDKCTVKCSGDASEICGGPWTLTVTANQDIIDARNSGLPPSPPYSELGCFADSVSARTFTGFSYKDDSMTPAMCAAKCSSLSFAFSGTEFGNECYCSNVAPVTTSNQCNKSCAGNSKLICGGPDALTVYQDSTLPVSAAPTCPGLPAGYAVCAEGQKVSGGKCVTA